MCAGEIVNPQASRLMKVKKENRSQKQKEKDEIVQDADVAADLDCSKLTSDGMLCKFGGHVLGVSLVWTFSNACLGPLDWYLGPKEAFFSWNRTPCPKTSAKLRRSVKNNASRKIFVFGRFVVHG